MTADRLAEIRARADDLMRGLRMEGEIILPPGPGRDLLAADLAALLAEIERLRAWNRQLLRVIEEEWYDERFGEGAYAAALAGGGEAA